MAQPPIAHSLSQSRQYKNHSRNSVKVCACVRAGVCVCVCVREEERQFGDDVDKLKPLHAMLSKNTPFSCLGP